MNRKLLIPFLCFLMVLIAFPGSSFAYIVVSKSDPQGVITGSPTYFAGKDEIRINYTSGTVKSTSWSFVETGTGRTFQKDLVAPSGNYYSASGFTCVGTYSVEIKGDSGNLLASLELEIQQGDLQKPTCESDASGEISDGKCDSCALLKCPGWGEFMGKLDDIKAAIPPPPNWSQVADTFRDSITPKIKEDLKEVIGEAPEPVMPNLPPVPEAPEPPPPLDPLDDRGLEAPTGEEAPGLEESTFTPDDIKKEAPIIQENSDPTGGFKIDNPIDGLPSQDEFKKNIPSEGTAPLPKAPKDPDNFAPIPPDQPGTAPIPTQPTNTAPIPGTPTATPPIPGTPTGTAPLPGSAITPVPIPGSSP